MPEINDPKITDPIASKGQAEFVELQRALDQHIPEKALDRSLLVATWNIRAFGDLTEKWESTANDSPKRDLYSLRCIAAIASRFDVIAVQEVRANIKALRHMLKVLGPDWGFTLTDVTRGQRGNWECKSSAFVGRIGGRVKAQLGRFCS